MAKDYKNLSIAQLSSGSKFLNQVLLTKRTIKLMKKLNQTWLA